MPSIHVVVPACNPGEVVIGVIERTRVHADAVVIVDDGCDAENRARLERCAHHPGVTLLAHAGNRGKGVALMTGIGHCLHRMQTGDYILTMDSDGQHDPEDIARFRVLLAEHPNMQFALGERLDTRAMPVKSRIGNGVATALFRLQMGTSIRDTQTGMRLLSEPFARRVHDEVRPGGTRRRWTCSSSPCTRSRGMTGGAITYAMETLVDTDAIDDDGTMYYHLMKNHELRAPLGGGARDSDDWSVEFEFTGMVLSDAATGASLERCDPGNSDSNGDDKTDVLDSGCNTAISPAPTVIAGGGEGASSVTFLVDNEAVAATDGVQLTAKFAISGNSGEAAMTVTNITLANLQLGTFTAEHPSTEVIKLASALDEVADGNNETATVDSGFMTFMGDTTDDDISVSNMGSFMVGYKTHLDAASDAVGGAVDNLDDLADTGTSGTPTMPNSTVTVMGDFSFASRVTLGSDLVARTGPDR